MAAQYRSTSSGDYPFAPRISPLQQYPTNCHGYTCQTGVYWCYSRGEIKYRLCYICGPGSSVGIATDYGLDGPGSNPGGDEIFRPSRPALWPTQPRVKWVTGLSHG